MSSVKELLTVMVTSIVDDESAVIVTESNDPEKGLLFEIRVGKDDVGKVIGKQGRIANAIRTVAKASGAKAGLRLMVNVFNKPVEEAEES